MNGRPSLKYCFIILIGLLMPLWVNAQGITASFDPTEAVVSPAAAGWRETESVGFSYRESSGNREVNGQETHKFDTTATTANLHFKMSNVSLDGLYAQSSNEVTVEQISDGWINLDNSISRLNIALSGNDFVSIGLGAQELRMHNFVDASRDSEDVTETSITGSISVKTLDFLYLGGGFEKVKEKSTYRVENTWNTTLLGASAIIGEPGGTRLRLEYSLASSPEVKSDAQGELGESIHEKNENSAYSAELMMNGLLFSFRGNEEKIFLRDPAVIDGEKYDTITVSGNEAGVLWIPENGVVLGFYFATSKVKFAFEDESSEFRVNIGYVFE